MRWHRGIALVALFLAWAVLAAWQFNEYQNECDAARQTLRRQAGSLMNAVVGGIRSHRRVGVFIQEQLQGALDELIHSADVLAASVTDSKGTVLLSAGRTKLLGQSSRDESWLPEGLQTSREFQLAPPPSNSAGTPGMGPGYGMGAGMGMGRGRMQRLSDDMERDEGPFSKGGHFIAILLLDRSTTDVLCRRAAWLRFTVTVAGGLVVLCVGWVWRTSVRLAEARGRAAVLEIETRHLRDLGQAAAGLAHETRNPLGLIRGWTQRWADSPDIAVEQRQQAQAVIEECDRVTARINQFLAFARSAKPRWETVDVREIVQELRGLLSPDLDAKKLVLQSDLPEKDALLQADREMFRQALFNLLQNAIQFSPEGETVTISLSAGQNGEQRIEIADRGPGVSAVVASSLFTPYFSTRSGGTGLGLAIVRSIALAHEWDAGYLPRQGGGAIFWINGLRFSRSP